MTSAPPISPQRIDTAAAEALRSLEKLRDADLLDDLDVEMARFLARHDAAGGSRELVLSSALVTRRLREGHVTVELRAHAGRLLIARPSAEEQLVGVEPAELLLPDLESWRAALAASTAVGLRGDGGPTPLVLDSHDRLSLRRYAEAEDRVARDLHARCVDVLDPATSVTPTDDAPDVTGLSTLDERQVSAVRTIRRRRLCILSGGPGTGKTTTVVRALAALVADATARGRALRIQLAAPTGKAAARMRTAVEQARHELESSLPPTVLAGIPSQAVTIHRLLGLRPGAAHGGAPRSRGLAVDVLVVDEASMIDLAMMARLLEGLPEQARLVLVGDRDQLSSVEPGSVFGEICPGTRPSSPGSASATGADGSRVPDDGPLAGSIVRLTRSFRFDDQSPIGQLAVAVREGDVAGALAILRGSSPSTGEDSRVLTWRPVEDDPSRLDASLLRALAPYVEAVNAGAGPEILAVELDRFRVLGALRHGPGGIVAMSQRIEKLLRARGLTDAGTDPWYAGRPIMVTRNDHALGLFNGDVGFVRTVETARGVGGTARRVAFPDADGRWRDLAPVQLPEHETVFATTVHKSQGSEFDAVLLMLPALAAAVATRELLYTAITRARRSVEIWATEETLRRVIAASSPRTSGLRDALADLG